VFLSTPGSGQSLPVIRGFSTYRFPSNLFSRPLLPYVQPPPPAELAEETLKAILYKHLLSMLLFCQWRILPGAFPCPLCGSPMLFIHDCYKPCFFALFLTLPAEQNGRVSIGAEGNFRRKFAWRLLDWRLRSKLKIPSLVVRRFKSGSPHFDLDTGSRLPIR
jgi:hypothetical protein